VNAEAKTISNIDLTLIVLVKPMEKRKTIGKHDNIFIEQMEKEEKWIRYYPY
tara:strand:+ start:198 stop:353 length:156 start_codon:yes stop_codon:yes gene_type:complete